MHRFVRVATVLALPVIILGCPAKEQPSGGTPTGGSPATQPSGTPPSTQPAGAATQPGAGADSGAPFSGLIKLADGTDSAAVKDADVLFVMARERLPDGKPGRLIAVQRHGKVSYPFRYEMSAKDLMMPGTPFSGPFLVQARLDKDGDPMTKGPEDLYAEYSAPVSGGQEGVHLVLAPGSAQQ